METDEVCLTKLPLTSEGLLIRSEMLAAGTPGRMIDAALRSGRIRRLQRAVYLPADHRVTPHLIASAALRSVSAPATVSHHTAARLHALSLAQEPTAEHVTVPFGARRPHRALLTVHCHDLDPDDILTIDGLPVTNPVRTAFDLLFQADQHTALWACDQAVRLGLVDIAGLRGRISAAGRAPGGRRARRLVEAIDPLSESPLETAARMVLRTAKLPPPRSQEPIVDETGRVIYRLDLAYPEWLLGIELDGRTVHETPEAILADRRRQNHLAVRGWTILRFTWFDVTRRPAYVVATVRDALAALRRAA